MSNRKHSQISRIRPVPVVLGRIIELVNCLPQELSPAPPETPQPHTLTSVVMGRNHRILQGQPSSTEEVRECWKRFVAQFPAPVRQYIGPIRGGTIQRAKFEYVSLGQAAEVLRFIAEGNRTKSLSRNSKYLPMGTLVRVGKGGGIEFQKNPIFLVLEGAEANRIRECLVCDKIFWAGRKDKKCCSSRCLKVWHTRCWRERYLDRYKYPRYLKAKQHTRLSPNKS